MKKVLVLYYSQTGQLKRVLDSFVSKLNGDSIIVHKRVIKPKVKYSFPWSFYDFFDEFPEAVSMDSCELSKIDNLEDDYNLIILGYTVWYMSPSIPVTSFLKSKQAEKLFKNKPVVSVVVCRDMWILAQERVKKMLSELDAKVIDHVALTDQGGSVKSLITLPVWMLTGDKQYFSFLPSAGINEEEINNCSRFGERLKDALELDKEKGTEALLTNLGATVVNAKLIATEKIASRSFFVWGKLIKLSGTKHSFGRKLMITMYVLFLLGLIFTVIPINIVARKILNIFQKEKLKEMEAFYELPSGR